MRPAQRATAHVPKQKCFSAIMFKPPVRNKITSFFKHTQFHISTTQ